MKLLQSLGFSYIELNHSDPQQLDALALKQWLGDYGLSMWMFATGLAARTHGLSLSDTDEATRLKSIDHLRRHIEFAAEMGCGIICGLIQGGASESIEEARRLFRASLEQIVEDAASAEVVVLVEATNKSLTPVANSLSQTEHLIEGLPPQTIRILADTYHMHFEETNICEALAKHIALIHSIHYSDNNRYYPGLGSLDFASITEELINSDYSGPVVLEANTKVSLEKDLTESVRFLSNFILV